MSVGRNDFYALIANEFTNNNKETQIKRDVSVSHISVYLKYILNIWTFSVLNTW